MSSKARKRVNAAMRAKQVQRPGTAAEERRMGDAIDRMLDELDEKNLARTQREAGIYVLRARPFVV